MKDFRDIYEFPLEIKYTQNRVYDAKGNFVFQFDTDAPSDLKEEILETINSNNNRKIGTYSHFEGEIIEDDFGPIIIIRGWGNLTGVGGHNLPAEVAANIQDTFSEYIVKRLNSDL